MIKELFSTLKSKYQSLGGREKLLVIIASALLGLLIVNGLFIQPLQNKRQSLLARKKTLQAKLKQLRLLAYKSGKRQAFFQGKDSDVINFIVEQLSENSINERELKQETDSRDNLIVKIKAKGKLNDLLRFIALMEKQNFYMGFQRANLKHQSHEGYTFAGELLVQKL